MAQNTLHRHICLTEERNYGTFKEIIGINRHNDLLREASRYVRN